MRRASDRGGRWDRLMDVAAAIDPGGARARYAVYVTACAALAALIGSHVGGLAGGAADHLPSGLFAAVVTGASLSLSRPRTGTTLAHDIAACVVAAAAGIALGALGAGRTALGQVVLVALVFVGFYVRRWGQPWSGAGMVAVIVYTVQLILGPALPRAGWAAGGLTGLVAAAAGLALAPRGAFTRAVTVAARRLRVALAPPLRAPPADAAAADRVIARIDDLLLQVHRLRSNADQLDAGASDRHLAVARAASMAARVCENVVEGLAKVATRRDVPAAVTATLGQACAAVADALERATSTAREVARAALKTLDDAVLALVTPDAEPNAGSMLAATALYDLLTVRLALGHLIDAAAALDAVLAGRAEGAP